MAKIKTEQIHGELGRYQYDLNYSARKQHFYAAKYPDFLANFIEYGNTKEFSCFGPTEEAVKIKFRKAIAEYEKTQDNWELYIFYKFTSDNHAQSKFGGNSSRDYRKSLSIDYTTAYYNEVDGQGYYAAKEHYEGHKAGKYSLNAHRVYGDYDTSGKSGWSSSHKIKHTPELEAFFESVCNGMDILITKVIGVLKDDEKVKLLSLSQNKLIG